MSTASLVAEGRWAHMQGLRIIVDFASGSNLYPDLHVAGVEAAAVYSNDAILSLHRSPENYYSAPQCETDFRFVLSRLDTLAFASNQTLYLREAGVFCSHTNTLCTPASNSENVPPKSACQQGGRLEGLPAAVVRLGKTVVCCVAMFVGCSRWFPKH
eukprot:m.1072564 g.1072564  ORF g.1072564 m.1072564 type:complete len:157 (+) comp24231_c0_seq118:4124-4594(+)